MKSLKILLPLYLLLIITACEKDTRTELEKLPPITTTGENTFGCLIDGKAFVPCCDVGWYWNSGGTLVIFGSLISSFQPLATMRVGFTKKNVFSTGTYEFLDCDPIICEEGVSFTGKEINFNRIDFERLQYIDVIKLDTINRIVSGTFEFNLMNDENEEVHITEGRFDIAY